MAGKSYIEYRLVEGAWNEHEIHSGASRRQVMIGLAKQDAKSKKPVPQRKVRKA